MAKNQYTNKEIFEDFPVGKSLRILSVPAIIGQLISLVYNLADTWFVGRLNNPLMVSATSLAFPIFALSYPVSAIAGTGGGTLISRLLGLHDKDQAKKTASFSIYLGFASALLYALILFLFMDPLLKFLGASSNNLLYTKQYLICVSVIGAVPTILTAVVSNLLRAVGHSKEAAFGTGMGGILNILLDPLFMFVLLPRDKAVIGAGLATALSNTCSLIYLMVIVSKLQNETVLNFSPKNIHPDKKYVKELFAVGLPAATSTLMFDINNMTLNKLMSSYGEIALAAMGITLKIERLSLNICIGLCMGMTPLVAYNYSAKNIDRMRAVVKKTVMTGVIVSIISIIFYESCAPLLANAFIADHETVVLSAAFLRRRALASGLMFLSFSLVHFFQGVGSGKHSFWLPLIRFGCVGIPAIYLMDHFFGMYGIPLAQLVTDIIIASVSWISYAKFIRKTK